MKNIFNCKSVIVLSILFLTKPLFTMNKIKKILSFFKKQNLSGKFVGGFGFGRYVPEVDYTKHKTNSKAKKNIIPIINTKGSINQRTSKK